MSTCGVHAPDQALQPIFTIQGKDFTKGLVMDPINLQRIAFNETFAKAFLLRQTLPVGANLDEILQTVIHFCKLMNTSAAWFRLRVRTYHVHVKRLRNFFALCKERRHAAQLKLLNAWNAHDLRRRKTMQKKMYEHVQCQRELAKPFRLDNFLNSYVDLFVPDMWKTLAVKIYYRNLLKTWSQAIAAWAERRRNHEERYRLEKIKYRKLHGALVVDRQEVEDCEERLHLLSCENFTLHLEAPRCRIVVTSETIKQLQQISAELIAGGPEVQIEIMNDSSFLSASPPRGDEDHNSPSHMGSIRCLSAFKAHSQSSSSPPPSPSHRRPDASRPGSVHRHVSQRPSSRSSSPPEVPNAPAISTDEQRSTEAPPVELLPPQHHLTRRNLCSNLAVVVPNPSANLDVPQGAAGGDTVPSLSPSSSAKLGNLSPSERLRLRMRGEQRVGAGADRPQSPKSTTPGMRQQQRPQSPQSPKKSATPSPPKLNLNNGGGLTPKHATNRLSSPPLGPSPHPSLGRLSDRSKRFGSGLPSPKSMTDLQPLALGPRTSATLGAGYALAWAESNPPIVCGPAINPDDEGALAGSASNSAVPSLPFCPPSPSHTGRRMLRPPSPAASASSLVVPPLALPASASSTSSLGPNDALRSVSSSLTRLSPPPPPPIFTHGLNEQLLSLAEVQTVDSAATLTPTCNACRGSPPPTVDGSKEAEVMYSISPSNRQRLRRRDAAAFWSTAAQQQDHNDHHLNDGTEDEADKAAATPTTLLATDHTPLVFTKP